MSEAYRLNLTPDDNGTLLVTSPSLPEVTSFGVDIEDAKAHGLNAVLEAMAARIRAGSEVPTDSARNDHTGPVVFVDIPSLVALKVDLYRLCRSERVTPAELVRRLGWNRESVDRLFRLDHASRLSQLEDAFRALGKRVTVSVTELEDA